MEVWAQRKMQACERQSFSCDSHGFQFLACRLQVCSSPCTSSFVERLKKRTKGFGSCQESVSIPDSGRRSATLLSLLSDLSDFLNWELEMRIL